MNKIERAEATREYMIFYTSVPTSMGVQSMKTEYGPYTKVVITVLDDLLEGMTRALSEYAIVVYDSIWEMMKPYIMYALLIVMACLTKDVYNITAMVIFVIATRKYLYDLLCSIFSIKLGSGKPYGRMEAAKNMAINAYNTRKRIPTMEELRASSRYSVTCPYRKQLTWVSTCAFICLMGSFVSRSSLKVCVIFIVLYGILSFIVKKYELIEYLQFFVTNEPTDEELELAHQGLRLFEKLDKSVEEYQNKGVDPDTFRQLVGKGEIKIVL